VTGCAGICVSAVSSRLFYIQALEKAHAGELNQLLSRSAL